jgi:hypothetical protein
MEQVRPRWRHFPKNAKSTQMSETTHVDIALSNGFALPKITAVIEVFQYANSLTLSRLSSPARYNVSLLPADGHDQRRPDEPPRKISLSLSGITSNAPCQSALSNSTVIRSWGRGCDVYFVQAEPHRSAIKQSACARQHTYYAKS